MATEQPNVFVRFTRLERVEHLTLLISFTILAVTGIPQKYVGQGWAEAMIAGMGGIEIVRWIHHASAIILLLGSVFHLVAAGYRVFVLHRSLSIMPQIKDAIDMLTDVAYNLGLRRQRALTDRYNYGEKIEYWAVVWGTVIMAITGFMMWNPITTSRFFPGDYIPAAKAAHGGEAILAVLSILIWHFYHVHIKRFNKSMFTGKITAEEMEHEHPLELARIERGHAPVPPDVATRRRRERVYVPIAAVFSVAMLVGLYGFVNTEQTAITTLPHRVTVTAYAPVTPTATPTPAPTPVEAATAGGGMPSVPHTLKDRENCLACHGTGAMRPFPADHEGRGNDTCLACHPAAVADAELPTTQPSTAPSFSTDILPIFQAKCAACHGQSGGLSLASYEGVMKGGSSGDAIVAGQPEQSLLIEKMKSAHSAQLSDAEMQAVQAWIMGGAPNN
jgi:cytochrome b subunit of formate dehydrogenase/mono/diheme cytochrome c family protein